MDSHFALQEAFVIGWLTIDVFVFNQRLHPVTECHAFLTVQNAFRFNIVVTVDLITTEALQEWAKTVGIPFTAPAGVHIERITEFAGLFQFFQDLVELFQCVRFINSCDANAVLFQNTLTAEQRQRYVILTHGVDFAFVSPFTHIVQLLQLIRR